MHNKKAFTLIEMVVVLAIITTIALVAAGFFLGPLQGYIFTRDINLKKLDINLALEQLGQDVTTALPRSVRVSADGKLLQLYPALDKLRYRHLKDNVRKNTAPLIVGNSIRKFDIYDRAKKATGMRLVINNEKYDDNNRNASVYGEQSTVITAANNQIFIINSGENQQIFLEKKHIFFADDPDYFAYLVTTPILYYCDEKNNALMRYSNFVATAALEVPTAATAESILQNVSQCEFMVKPYDRAELLKVALATDIDRQKQININKNMVISDAFFE